MVSKVWSSRTNKVQGSLSGCKIPQSQTKSTPENKTRRQANMAENVRVAVRVRPFNSREKARNASLIINMVGSSTKITDPEAPNAEPKKFAFDFSYWSHDCFKELDNGYLEPTDSKYADQKKVFDDLGQGVLENAWKGYNCSLFAYGQTGSGKSYSMVGYGANKGIVPIFCETLFKEIDEKKNSGEKAEYQVALSMLEIYNEQVRDLLNPASNKKGGLKVRQHPNKGFYVESLVTVPVKSYADIDNRIEEGTKSRTVAATNMNATSSRAHTIVAINFSQKSKNEAGQNMTKTSIVNLVDLAGSERAESTGATGDRLKEGSAINQSLSMLGNCIKALADQSMGKKNVLVPFRDSVLTKLLKNALGGNSKTIMIAALSPADINYEETLSTLRFADRAKSIKTKAIINESPTDKLIRELREENARLLEQIKKGGVVYVQGEAPEQQLQPGGPSEEEMEEMKREMEEQLRRNQSEMEQMEKSWKERLMETEAAYKAKEEAEKKEKEMRKTTPHFWNLNEDPQLSNMIVHFIKPGSQRIGNRKADPPADITLSGLSILPDHAAIKCEKTTIKIKPSKNAKLTINGKPCTEETELHHNDRVMFGSSNLFVVHHPTELDKAIRSGSTVEKITYDMAQEEIAQNSGFNMDKTGGKSNDELLLQEDLLKLVPMVNEANAMSEELGKKVKFELMLISPQARGLKEGRTEVKVKMKSTEDDAEWVWDRNKFFNRKYLMQEMYQNYVEGEEDWDKTKEEDPFWEPDDVDVMIGTVQVYLQSLAYNIELEENLAITDHRGEDKGHLQVDIFPCDEKGNEDIDDFVEEPEELVGKNLNFNLKIPSARGLPQRFSKGKTYCSFKFYLEKEASLTQTIENTINPNFAYKKRFSYSPVTKQFLDYLQNQPLVIEVWGKQVGRKISKAGQQTGVPKAVANKKALQPENTQALQQKQTANGGPAVSRTATMSPDEQRTRDLQLTKSIKRADRSERKLKKIREMVEEAKKNNNTSVPVSEIEDILNGEGGKFKATASVVMTTSKAAAENDGKITSAACAIQ